MHVSQVLFQLYFSDLFALGIFMTRSYIHVYNYGVLRCNLLHCHCGSHHGDSAGDINCK